jgi:ATPase subunit of ABC transporter with duplicated ATPase domains
LRGAADHEGATTRAFSQLQAEARRVLDELGLGEELSTAVTTLSGTWSNAGAV